MTSDPIDVMVRELACRDPLPAGEAGDAVWAREAIAEILAEPRPPARRPSRRRVVLRALPAVVSVAALAALAVVLLVAAPARKADEAAAPAGDPNRISALERPARAGDALPAWVLADPVVGSARVNPASSRLLDRRAGRLVYAARSRQPPGGGWRTPHVCLIDVVSRTPGTGFRPGRPGRMTCVPDERLRDGGFVLMPAGFAAPGQRTDLSGLVPDGFDLARAGDREGRIDGNLLRIPDAQPWRAVRISGSAGTRTDWSGEPPPSASRPRSGRELPVALFRTPPVPLAALPPRIRRAVSDEPGRRAWRVEAAGATYWLLTSARPGANVLTIGDAISGGRLPTSGYPLNWTIASSGRQGGPQRYRISALVGDGYTQASAPGQRVDVRRNFVVLTGVSYRVPFVLTLTGSAGRFDLTLPLSSQGMRYLAPVDP